MEASDLAPIGAPAPTTPDPLADDAPSAINAAHPNDDTPTEEEIAATRAEVEAQAEEDQWDAAAASAESGSEEPDDASDASEPASSEPTLPTPDETPSTSDESDTPDGGGDDGPPADQAEPRQRSGAATRPYHILEEVPVVRVSALTDEWQGALRDAGVIGTGFVERDATVIARNTDHALGLVYDAESPKADDVTGVLALSERAYNVIEPEVEVQRTARVNLKRR